MTKNSDDIFKKTFSKSADEERQRSIDIEKERQIREEEDRAHIEAIRGDVESVVSQIPSVFQVSEVSFYKDVRFSSKDIRFWVRIPEDDSRLIVTIQLAGWSQPQKYCGDIAKVWEDRGRDARYLASTDPWLGREEIGKWLASELGRILGEEYERHRDFYEKMEEGL